MQVKAATLILFLFLLLSSYVLGQGPCPTATLSTTATLSRDLVCTVPQVYGPGGLVGTNNGGALLPTNSATFHHEVHFQDSSLASFAPLTAEIGTALSQLPLTSPASGFVFSFNSALGGYTRSAENFGPILTERPD